MVISKQSWHVIIESKSMGESTKLEEEDYQANVKMTACCDPKTWRGGTGRRWVKALHLVQRMSSASYLNGVVHPERAILMCVSGLVCGFDKTSSQIYAWLPLLHVCSVWYGLANVWITTRRMNHAHIDSWERLRVLVGHFVAAKRR